MDLCEKERTAYMTMYTHTHTHSVFSIQLVFTASASYNTPQTSYYPETMFHSFMVFLYKSSIRIRVARLLLYNITKCLFFTVF